MRTYAVREARTKTTGHYRREGADTLYCNRPVGIPNGDSLGLPGWKMCATCVNGEARDRAEAEAVAAQHTEPAEAPAKPTEQAPPVEPTEPQQTADTIRAELARTRARYSGLLATAHLRDTWEEHEKALADAEAARIHIGHLETALAAEETPAVLGYGFTTPHPGPVMVCDSLDTARQIITEAPHPLRLVQRTADGWHEVADDSDQGDDVDTWRGQWIGRRPDDDVLFEIERAEAEQGALFA